MDPGICSFILGYFKKDKVLKYFTKVRNTDFEKKHTPTDIKSGNEHHHEINVDGD